MRLFKAWLDISWCFTVHVLTMLFHLKVWKRFEEVGHISLFKAAVSDICDAQVLHTLEHPVSALESFFQNVESVI